MKARWALFISGQGSNMSALLDQKWDLEIACVVSSSPKAPGLFRARRSGVPTIVLDAKINWSQLVEQLRTARVTHIFLLGFMRIVPQEFLKNWKGVILNVHPSLLPNYPGLRSIERAHQEGAAMGITVHHVSPQVDAGHVVLQKPVISADKVKTMSLEMAEQKMHQAEYTVVRKAAEKIYA
jgi:phosphoribosylglycinamide formyltransferase 1